MARKKKQQRPATPPSPETLRYMMLALDEAESDVEAAYRDLEVKKLMYDCAKRDHEALRAAADILRARAEQRAETGQEED